MTPGPLNDARRLVLKVGSSLVTLNGAPAAARLAGLAADCADLIARGCEVVIVSSGAVALGRARLGLGSGRLALEEKQAAAAAGQSALMASWEAAFMPYDRKVAQALLTSTDTEDRRRWLNARATLETLLRLGAMPIVNENDTVATEEIRVGDNDRLAARVATMVGADTLVLLSDVDGLYAEDPRRNPGARHISMVDRMGPEIEAMAGAANTAAGVGTGGMATKLEAARIATGGGARVIIAAGDRDPRPLDALSRGARCTVFEAPTAPRAAYKAWILGTLKPNGAVQLDAGAKSAVLAGKSLLPAGVVAVLGSFGKGDVVRILGPGGEELGRGIAAYESAEATMIRGLRSDAAAAKLGWEGPAALIHADHLALRD
jgi:glutamate 5-kinase